jgi:hypothetical protein
MVPHEFHADVQTAAAELAPEMARREELYDLLRFRTFRMTVVCRADAAIDRALSTRRLAGTHLSGHLLEPETGVFRTPRGDAMSVERDESREALRRLAAAWPATVPFEELPAPAGRDLLRCVARGLVRAQLSPARCALRAGDRPLAAAHARLAARGPGLVPNLRHENVQMNDAGRRLLARLDGTRDRATLEAELGADGPALLDELARKGLLLA